MRPLVADGSGFSVAGVHDSVVGEGQELFADAPEQGGVIAAGEVGCADAFAEKDVAADEEALVR